jgi:hypothetical protein
MKMPVYERKFYIETFSNSQKKINEQMLNSNVVKKSDGTKVRYKRYSGREAGIKANEMYGKEN